MEEGQGAGLSQRNWSCSFAVDSAKVEKETDVVLGWSQDSGWDLVTWGHIR